MKEEYLHYVFKKKMLGKTFKTRANQTIEIVDFGEHNVNAGPDFLDVQLTIDGQLWAGSVEFHIKSSDWYRHKHEEDVAYQNVIAHFVYTYDGPVNVKNVPLPTVVIRDMISDKHYQKYKHLIQSRDPILCQSSIDQVPPSAITEQKQQSLKDRLWDKSLIILRDIETWQGDRKKAFHLALARSFGGRVNQVPAESLMSRIDTNWLAKLNHDNFRVEALFLGLAGLIPEVSRHVYTAGLKAEFDYQKKLFGLTVIPNQGWKYSRMRPSGFPDIRLAQLAAVLNKDAGIDLFFDENAKLGDLVAYFDVELNGFWKSHFCLGHAARQPVSLKLSRDMIDLVLINAVVPFVFAIGLWEGNDRYNDRAIQLLTSIKPEKNGVINQWKKMGVEVKTAFDSQSLLQLKKHSCSQKKCLFCALGKSMLNR